MWESPIYKINQHVGTDRNGNEVYKEIVINVTKSAPSFSEPKKALRGALSETLARAGVTKSQKILDFGSGKLRIALYLLQEGYKVSAVEYEDMFVTSKPAASTLQSLSGYRKRFSLIYPHKFTSCTPDFDLALLINVMNIMPVPAERLLVLQYCNQKLHPGGHLLWYTQRGDKDYKKRRVPEFSIGDGHYVGRKTKYKKFYREYEVTEIDSLLKLAGFELVSPIEATWRNQARLYRKIETASISKVLSASDIKSARVVDEKIPLPTKVEPRKVASPPKRKGNPNPDKLKVEHLHIKTLKKIPVGALAATKYQKHVKTMLEVLFRKELRNLKLESKVFGRLKRLDIRASNKGDSGFFHSLKEDDIYCPTIIIECKNYGHEIGNPEFDQLGSRLGKKIGFVGILAYRKAANYSKVMDRCRAFYNNEQKIILPLSDNNFEELLTLKMQPKEDEDEDEDKNEDKIENYLDDLLFEIRAG